MTLDDDGLQRLLQNVDFPADLPARLREIPEQATKHRRETPPRDTRRIVGWAVAASVLAIAAIASALWMRQFSGQPAERIVRRGPPPTDRRPDIGPETSPTNRAEGSREIQDNLVWVTDLVQSLEVDALRQARDEMRQYELRTNADPRNLESLIVGLADRSALDWGASRTSVSRDMQQILDEYPGSLGAELASEVLAQ